MQIVDGEQKVFCTSKFLSCYENHCTGGEEQRKTPSVILLHVISVRYPRISKRLTRGLERPSEFTMYQKMRFVLDISICRSLEMPYSLVLSQRVSGTACKAEGEALLPLSTCLWTPRFLKCRDAKAEKRKYRDAESDSPSVLHAALFFRLDGYNKNASHFWFSFPPSDK